MYHKEIRYGDVNWIHLAQDRDQWWVLVNTVMNLWVPQNAGNFLTTLVAISVSRKNAVCS
jgi:hypothetical protein